MHSVGIEGRSSAGGAFSPPPPFPSLVIHDPSIRPRCHKSHFSPAEDDTLRALVLAHGTGSWDFIATLMGTRNSRQCRERWKNYLNPDLRSDPWTLEEDQLLVDRYAQFGSKWNIIARFFRNRSENSIRNRWEMMLRQWDRQNISWQSRVTVQGR
jgi:hypothetical protein